MVLPQRLEGRPLSKQELEVLILRMRKVLAMDATGLNALEDLFERLRRKGKHLVLSAPALFEM